ncbi:MAG TPA: transglycosylase SLT domain-containing protein [Treponemataceae bacterium]|nr:transglycosylase SLT domain-containing protein [Treponemataceae bacterium]
MVNKTKKSRLTDLFRMFLGPMLFSLFLAVSCVYVSLYVPADMSTTDPILITEENNAEVLEDDFEEEVYRNPHAIDPVDYHTVVVNYKEKADLGLTLYRSLQSRAAVVSFYNKITHSTDVTLAIVENADANDIPLSLAFALAYTESRYKVRAVNKNKNASIDRGLFQLNNNSFPKLTEAEFYNPYISAKYGMAHLRFCLDTAGNETAALAMYNAGTTRVRANGTPQVTLNYVDVIMNYREGLDALLTSQVAVLFENEVSTMIAMVKTDTQ